MRMTRVGVSSWFLASRGIAFSVLGLLLASCGTLNKKLHPAVKGGVENRYIVVLDTDTGSAQSAVTISVETRATGLTRRFGGQPLLAWDHALRGFVVTMTEDQARRMARDPSVKGVYQDIELDADEVLANEAPYCYPSEARRGCAPPGNWILNTRTSAGLPQAIQCDDPDPRASGCVDNWGLDRLDGAGRDGVFQTPARGAGVHVYVLDTGVHAANVDFGGRVIYGRNATLDEPGCTDCFPLCVPPCGTDTDDYHGYGTHVAGIVGGRFFGVAKDVQIHPVRYYNRSCRFVQSALVDALDWIASVHDPGLGTGIVNFSAASPGFATRPDYQPLRDAFMGVAARDDLLVVQAAGNGSEDACGWTFGDESRYPPGSPEHEATAKVLVVGGSDEKDDRWICDPAVDENCFTFNQGSNFGRCVDIFGPAAHIVSAYHGGGGTDDDKAVCRLSGTSMASPHVAGAAALILESDPFMSAPLLRARILGEAAAGVLNATPGRPGYIGAGSPNLLVQATGSAIFSDGFESGDVTAWRR